MDAQPGMDERAGDSLIPVRMVNEYAYCPRLFHLMQVEGEWMDNVFTEDGKRVHRRVDSLDHVLPDADTESPGPERSTSGEGDEPPTISRSVTLGSDRLGIIGKLDLVSTVGDEAVPVERKRGRVPPNEQGSYEPERVQLMAQGLLLREHGFRCDHGILYFAASRKRITVPFSPELESRAVYFIEAARQQSRSREFPPPLRDSRKCNGCSLSGICLPDETVSLTEAPRDTAAPEVRRLYPARPDASPFYVQEQGARLGTEKGVLVVRRESEKLASIRLMDIDHIVLLGNISISPQALHICCEAGIPIVHCSMGHWFYGVSQGITLRNAFNKAAQFAAVQDPARRLVLARQMIFAKIANQRTMLRRNGRPLRVETLASLQRLARYVEHTAGIDELMGIEGNAAKDYFGAFSDMLRPPGGTLDFQIDNRNRRPPLDPVNAMLSFGYALLAKECTIALLAVGLEPHWGLYHAPRHGRPALALDLMEEFRPLIVDSAVVTAINTGMVQGGDFTRSKSGCVMKPHGRKAMIRAFEMRLDQLVTHPQFDYRVSWRSMIRLQARILARALRGDVAGYRGMTTR